jgi:hypothetical protein
MRPSDGGDTWAASTKFENIPHAQLLTMVAGANPQAVLAVGNALASASTNIQSLADDLVQHINGLQWNSAAGDSFRAWGRQVVSATDTLAIYASNTAVSINMAGETLSTTKLPEIPPGPKATVNAYAKQFDAKMVTGADGTLKVAQPLNPGLPGPTLPGSATISQSQAYQAQLQLDAAHQEAIGQMEKLGGSYVGAKQTLGVSTVPNFPPTPGELMPPKGSGVHTSSGNTSLAGGGSPGAGGAGGGSVTVRKSGGAKNSGSASGSADHGGTGFSPPQAPTKGAGGGNASGGGTTTLQGAQPPTSPTSPTGGGATGPAGGATGHGGVVGPAPTTGGGTIEPGGTGTSASPKPGGRDPGIHGGEPGAQATPGDRGGNRLGAGAVGASKGAGGRSLGARGGGIGGSLGRAGAGVANGVSSSGTPGAVAAESSGSGTARAGLSGEAAGEHAAPMTEGAGSGGMMPMGAGGVGGARANGRGRNRRRAAYLLEDEETWTQDGEQVNPVVIQ